MSGAPLRQAILVLVALVGVGASGALSGAQEQRITPKVTLSQTSVEAGDHVLVTIEGFSAPFVTMTVCGNLAARRSMDCNLAASEGRRLNGQPGATVADMPVSVPPTTCPCLLMVSTTNFVEVASAPIDIIGHPTGPVVEPASLEPVEVSVTARKATLGLIASLRSWLAGPTTYDVDVSARNASTLTLDNVVLTGVGGRGGDGDVATLDIPSVGPLAPGQTWEHTVRATVPAPVLGAFVWQVTASGAGRSISAEERTTALPLGFVLLVALFGVDAVAIAWRRIRRRTEPPAGAEARSTIDLRSATQGPSSLDLRDPPVQPAVGEAVGVDASSDARPY